MWLRLADSLLLAGLVVAGVLLGASVGGAGAVCTPFCKYVTDVYYIEGTTEVYYSMDIKDCLPCASEDGGQCLSGSTTLVCEEEQTTEQAYRFRTGVHDCGTIPNPGYSEATLSGTPTGSLEGLPDYVCLSPR